MYGKKALLRYEKVYFFALVAVLLTSKSESERKRVKKRFDASMFSLGK